MLSIGEFAKAANISPRALRHYESKGLIRASIRGENNYRYFDRRMVEEVAKIRDLQRLGFSLDEVRDVLSLGTTSMTATLEKKLISTEDELGKLCSCRDRIRNLLSISQRIETSQAIRLHERRVYMDAVNDEVIRGLSGRLDTSVNEVHLEYLRREKSLYNAPEKREFIEAVKKCISFAKEHNLTLGPGRGSCPASIVLYGLGFSGIDPTRYDLIPERLSINPPDIHIDVEFERGQPFVDFCRKVSESLAWGQVTAFKMPLLDIINNVHKKIGGSINYRGISDDDEIVLGNIQRGDIEKIFLIEYSPDALVMKFENYLPGYTGMEKIKGFLSTAKIQTFRDVVNIISVWRPNHQEKIKRIERYKQANLRPQRYQFLTVDLRKALALNSGVVIYHEDIIRIISAYTEWDMERCSKLRRDIRFGYPNPDFSLFKEMAPNDVFELVRDESPWTFCKAHAMSFAQLTKQTSVLKSLHKRIYYDEIARWEDRNGHVWDDIGIKMKGVSLLQH
jgi:DNA polymerase III alpha subunit